MQGSKTLFKYKSKKGKQTMKSKSKIVAIMLTVILVVAAVTVLVACEKETTKVAYGLVHKQGYVGKATVIVVGDTIISAELDEACLPTYVKATEINDYTVQASGGIFYKTVRFDDVTMTYDVEQNTYVVGNQTMTKFFEIASNCEKYFEAVAENRVSVVTASGNDNGILTASALLKSQNSYWSGNSIRDGQLGWKANADATCKYVLENGFDGASEKSDFSVQDNSTANANLDNEIVDKNGKRTGATWTDFWDYFVLLKTAYASN